MARFATLLLLPVLIESVLSISFFLPVNSRKCLREEIHKDVLVTGEYEISDQSNTKTNLKITDSSGHILYSKEGATKGKFAFTTEDYDMFEVCFESKSPMGTGRIPDQLLNLDMKHGVEAKNYEEIAKVEKLKPLEVELRRLEDLSESIVNDFAYMKRREEEMRDTNGKKSTVLIVVVPFTSLTWTCVVCDCELLGLSILRNLPLIINTYFYAEFQVIHVIILMHSRSYVCMHVCSISNSVLPSSRVHQHTRPVLQHLLYVLSDWLGHLAGLLPATLLQGKEAD
uniref:Transmembrane p24 trafficking protein 10 n=1 Tax=Oncorhynchus kisutch TaxID=8019 RepID=A0A8C7JE11_ONCKI